MSPEATITSMFFLFTGDLLPFLLVLFSTIWSVVVWASRASTVLTCFNVILYLLFCCRLDDELAPMANAWALGATGGLRTVPEKPTLRPVASVPDVEVATSR